MLSQLHRRFAPAAVAGVALISPLASSADPRLECQISYGGQDFALVATPDPDPYRRHSVAIADRFRFTATVTGNASQVDTIKLYVHALDDGRPVPVQAATYASPQAQPTPSQDSLTGRQQVYGSAFELELIYACALRDVTPELPR